MSIPGVGPSIVGQVAQEAAVSFCGRFVNLFQNRYAAGGMLLASSAVGIVGGLFAAYKLRQLSKPLIAKVFPNLSRSRNEYKLCKNVALYIIWAVNFITLNVIVCKCLKLPFSRLTSVGISIAGGALGMGGFVYVVNK